MQASHCLEGILGFRLNFNPFHMTLETGYKNRLRWGCMAALLVEAAPGALSADADALSVAARAASQITGVRPNVGSSPPECGQSTAYQVRSNHTLPSHGYYFLKASAPFDR
jgi:hypothetical protein